MYLKVWRFRLYIRCEARMVKRNGKSKHARELARTAKVAQYQHALDWLAINAPTQHHHHDTVVMIARELANR